MSFKKKKSLKSTLCKGKNKTKNLKRKKKVKTNVEEECYINAKAERILLWNAKKYN